MAKFDCVIKNTEIMDGSGGKGYIADVAIRDGKIAKIGKAELPSEMLIDGKGLTLSPGFVDVHTHSDTQSLSDPSRMCKVMQGVTFEIGGQCGWSRGPADPEMPKDGFEYYQTVNNGGYPLTLYPSYQKLLDSQRVRKLGAHQMTFVGHHILRASTVGMAAREPTEKELSRMKQLLEEAMSEGAPGLSSGLVYAPGCYSKTEELIELAKVAAKYDGIYTTHMRDESSNLLQAVGETIRIAKETGIDVNISHFKVLYKKNLPLLEQAVKMIDNAIAEGCNIFFDAYPYEATSATILSTLPPSYLTHGISWLLDEINSPGGVARMENSILHPVEDWENPLLNAGFEKIMIVWANVTQDAEGKTIHEYALEKGMRDIEAYVQLLSENKGAVSDVRFLMENESLSMLYRHPRCMVGTDGLYLGNRRICHPRAFATFTRYLGRIIRDQGVLPFEEGIRRITGMPADCYHLSGKGYIREGYDADLVLFDKNKIIDHATYSDPFAQNEGIEMVMVGGEAEVVRNIPTGVLNGKIICRT